MQSPWGLPSMAKTGINSFPGGLHPLHPSNGSMQPATTTPSHVPQRSAFGIQQLLGLSSGNSSGHNQRDSHPSSGRNTHEHSSPAITSLSVSNLIPHSNHQTGSVQVQSGYTGRSHLTGNVHHHGLPSPHHQPSSGHCFSAADSARLAYLNSPAAAALMSASMHGGGNHAAAAAAAACMAPNVSSMSMFHSFGGTVDSLARNDCGPGKFA